jgi:acid phosphatase type 7
MSIIKKLVKYLLVIAIAYGVGRFVVVFQGSMLSGYRAPYIQMLSTNNVIIRWMTEENQLGVVKYGQDPDQMSSIMIEGSSTKNHMAKLANLKPATKYYYQTGMVSGFSDNNLDEQWFYTQPKEVTPTRIWVIGDSGEPGETQDQVRDSALAWMQANPLDSDNDPLIDIWISLGDIAYKSGTNAQFQAALFEPYADLLANTALWPVLGNHDDRRWTYFRVFDLPENAEAGGIASRTEHYYAIDYSNVHFVMLDSQASDRSKNGDMADWLKRDLAKNTKPWVIAAFHHPPYSKGSHDSDEVYDSRGRMQDMRENIVPILEQAGVDLVLSGHSHMYERSYLLDCAYETSDKFSEKNIVSNGVNGKHQDYLKPLQEKAHQGAIYATAGSASKVDQAPVDHPAHHVGLLEAGSMVIDVVDNKLTARFINNEGQVSDEFSITKQADYKSEYQGCEK